MTIVGNLVTAGELAEILTRMRARMDAGESYEAVAAEEAANNLRTLRKGQCVAMDDEGNELAWVVEGHPELVISKIKGMK